MSDQPDIRVYRGDSTDGSCSLCQSDRNVTVVKTRGAHSNMTEIHRYCPHCLLRLAYALKPFLPRTR